MSRRNSNPAEDPLSVWPDYIYEPTNGRPWPGLIVTATLGGRQVYGRVDWYEWCWQGRTFPVKFELGGALVTHMMLPSDVEVIGGTRWWPPATES
jgi:hypothetical protein